MSSLVESTALSIEALDAKRIDQLAQEVAKNPAAHDNLRKLFIATERASWQEEVMAGTACELGAATLGFRVIPRDAAVIDITISSKVRQVGKTCLSALILDTLGNAGFSNVELVTPYTGTEGNYKLDKERLAKLAEANGDIKIRLIDDPVFINC